MKKLSKRWISLFLSLLMFCTSIPVYAEDVQTAMVVFEPMEHGTITVDGEDVTGQEREILSLIKSRQKMVMLSTTLLPHMRMVLPSKKPLDIRNTPTQLS